MVFTTKLLVFVVTLMSFINHSYLIITIVELPNISHITYEDYKNAVAKTAALYVLDENQFQMAFNNYQKTIEKIKDDERYNRLRKVLPNWCSAEPKVPSVSAKGSNSSKNYMGVPQNVLALSKGPRLK
ncbi:uncharacterized protein LOC132919017 [Rhopalosiphum padi]|uniref:uncharacterized protein LOC132919017 n=1 Tax=Rhopalosiphum padi TaxID=40932 RepID=UPI00298E3C3B|nr:uncharacterized protein LOC132919017 [Rhopalosiphum padi]